MCQMDRLKDAIACGNNALLLSNPEDTKKIELLEMKGRIHVSLGNYKEAIKDMGDVYEEVCLGKNFDDQCRQSKLKIKKKLICFIVLKICSKQIMNH